MRISFCSCHVASNGLYFEDAASGNRSNGPMTCIWESIAPWGNVKVSGAGLGSCLTYGSALMSSGISHSRVGAVHDHAGKTKSEISKLHNSCIGNPKFRNRRLDLKPWMVPGPI